MEADGKVLWSVREACEALSIGRTLLLRMTAEGSVPAVVIGRRRLYPREEMLRWVNELPRVL